MVICLSSSSRVARPFLGGRKPSNTKRSHGSPELTSAGTKAVAPGRVSTSMPWRLHSRESRNPGSLMPGVPASLMSAMTAPSLNCRTTALTASCSLNLWWLRMGVAMSKCLSSTPLVRVSSASTMSAALRTSTALGVMSPRFPTGVGTMYNLPAIAVRGKYYFWKWLRTIAMKSCTASLSRSQLSWL